MNIHTKKFATSCKQASLVLGTTKIEQAVMECIEDCREKLRDQKAYGHVDIDGMSITPLRGEIFLVTVLASSIAVEHLPDEGPISDKEKDLLK